MFSFGYRFTGLVSVTDYWKGELKNGYCSWNG